MSEADLHVLSGALAFGGTETLGAGAFRGISRSALEVAGLESEEENNNSSSSSNNKKKKNNNNNNHNHNHNHKPKRKPNPKLQQEEKDQQQQEQGQEQQTTATRKRRGARTTRARTRTRTRTTTATTTTTTTTTRTTTTTTTASTSTSTPTTTTRRRKTTFSRTRSPCRWLGSADRYIYIYINHISHSTARQTSTRAEGPKTDTAHSSNQQLAVGPDTAPPRLHIYICPYCAKSVQSPVATGRVDHRRGNGCGKQFRVANGLLAHIFACMSNMRHGGALNTGFRPNSGNASQSQRPAVSHQPVARAYLMKFPASGCHTARQCPTLLSEPTRKVAVFQLSKLRNGASATPKQQGPEGRTEPPGNGSHCLTLLSEPTRKLALFQPSRLTNGALATAKQQGPEGRTEPPGNGSQTSSLPAVKAHKRRLRHAQTAGPWRTDRASGQRLPLPNVAFWTYKKTSSLPAVKAHKRRPRHSKTAGPWRTDRASGQRLPN